MGFSSLNFFEKNKKEVISLFLLFLIVPFFLIPGLTKVIGGTFIEVWDILFAVILLGGLSYVIYELVIFVMLDTDENIFNLITFLLLGFVYGVIYSYFAFQYILDYEQIFNVQSFMISLLILFVATNLVLTILPGISLNKQLTFATVISLVTSFFMFLLFATIYYSFAMIFLIVVMTSISDMSGYFFGKRFGNRKVVPTISPNKTLEGFLGGALAAFSFGLIWYFITIFPNYSTDYIIGVFPKWTPILAICLIVVAAPLGDLFFSKIKRAHNIKDFGNIIPTHGGALDRIDSHIFAINLAVPLLILFS